MSGPIGPVRLASKRTPRRGPDVSHDAQVPSDESSLKNADLFGPSHACLTCYRVPATGAAWFAETRTHYRV